MRKVVGQELNPEEHQSNVMFIWHTVTSASVSEPIQSDSDVLV